MNDFTLLTPAQREAIDKWTELNDPNGDGFEFQDNHRYADASNPRQCLDYDDLRNGGCCGSVDVVLYCSDKTTLLYGFNYGH